jgi:transcriptional regulator with XRE-family HTH domain
LACFTEKSSGTIPGGVWSGSEKEVAAVDPKWFGVKLRELREQRGLTQQKLSDLSGVPQRSIANWERGIRDPGWSSVLALCQALGVSCEVFTQQPAPVKPAGPGRPRKQPAAGEVPAQQSGQEPGEDPAGAKGRAAGGKRTRRRKKGN